MNDKLKFEEEIERRLNDSLWDKRMQQAVLSRVRSTKRRRLGVAAAILFTASVGVMGFGASQQDSINAWLTGSSSDEESISQQYMQWGGYSKFPLQEDEELSIVLGNTYYE